MIPQAESEKHYSSIAGPAVNGGDLALARKAFRDLATQRMLHTPRYRMRYLDWGSGPAIVFIHGMADAA
ncbi:MAG TPA: hypothetical protein VLM40_07715, partial [Gemmata sp.]|nr:hypothetical protein [Gemmata sp.]